MENLCRLCCSERFVNNYIFDEEYALHLKMALYLPIKIVKNDRLPQKICDKCSCKVNDFYQFCNESIEAQNKLKAFQTLSKGEQTEDLDSTKEKNDSLSAVKVQFIDRSTQTEAATEDKSCDKESGVSEEQQARESPVHVKQEPIEDVKQEDETHTTLDTSYIHTYDSDSSDNMSLMNLKLVKENTNDLDDNTIPQIKSNSSVSKKKHSMRRTENGNKKNSKRKHDFQRLVPFMNAIPKGTSISVVKEGLSQQLKLDVKQEVEEVDPDELGIDMKKIRIKDIKQESDDSLYVCCVCYIETHSRKEMTQHYRTHADLSQLRASPPPAPPPPDNLPAPCPRCKKEVSAALWGSHWRRHWELDRRPYRCSRCSLTFREHNAIFRHGLHCKVLKKQKSSDPTENLFLCDLCPERFEYLKCLRAHRSQAHPGEQRALRLRCPLCARAFLHLNSLRRHVRAHSGRRDFLCNVCGKGLSSAEHLKTHIQIHDNVKPNVCKTCGKAFVKKTNLTMHERVHTGEKPYVCPHCGKAFSQRSTLVIHERYHSGSRPYVCSLCGRGFVARGLLSMHLKVACI